MSRKFHSILNITFVYLVAGLFSTGATQQGQASSNNNSKPTNQQGGTGEIITLKPNKQRTQGKKSKFASCSILG